jgi:hypothetical protein
VTRGVEKYYSVWQTAHLLDLAEETVIDKLKAGQFGTGVVNLGGTGGKDGKPYYRIPASGLNAYLDARRLFSEDINHDLQPVAARTVGELRRKT